MLEIKSFFLRLFYDLNYDVTYRLGQGSKASIIWNDLKRAKSFAKEMNDLGCTEVSIYILKIRRRR